MPYIVICIRLHDGRYHGSGNWPPVPARVFQAIVAGAGLSGPLDAKDQRALRWLEQLDPPIIGAPRAHEGQQLTMYVPGNDLDKVKGDPRHIGDIRDVKLVRPWLFDAREALIYAWPFVASRENHDVATRVGGLASRLYQLGRGVDLAWAWGETLEPAALETLLATYLGTVVRPTAGRRGLAMACPSPGSLDSLEARYYSRRFTRERKGKTTRTVFEQPPAPKFALVSYDSPCDHYLYDLRRGSPATAVQPSFAPWPHTATCRLVTATRDLVVDRLRAAFPQRVAEIDRTLIGRRPDGVNDGPPSARVQIIPLPSIGHAHADRAIRRILVEVPASCPLQARDIEWAFSDIELVDQTTGDQLDIALTPAQPSSEKPMLDHYGVDTEPHRVWHTVTPVALPYIHPKRGDRTHGAAIRLSRTANAIGAVRQALRHAGVHTQPDSVWVQREPFSDGHERAEAFAQGTRFASERLWHVEIAFLEAITGPLVIGDGRFLGLGLMAPTTGFERDSAQSRAMRGREVTEPHKVQ